MDNINLRDISSYLLQKVWLIVAILLTVFIGGEAYTAFIKTPLYDSSTNVVLISDSKSTSDITVNDVTLSNNLVKTYSEIVKSRNVLSKVISDQKLNMSYEALAGKVSVTSVASTQLITIRVSDENPKQAKQIANSIGKIFKSEIKSIYGIDNVQIVDKAVEATSAYNINIVKESLIYLIAGIVLGVGAAYVMYILDKTIKDTDVVENRLGLTVIGVVPEVGEK